MKKIAILDVNTVTKGDICFDSIDTLGEVSYHDMTTQDRLVDIIGDSDALVCNKARITREIMQKCKNLKYVGLFATGYNNIDLDAANEYGVTVCNVPGYSTESVAQHVFAFILEFASSLSKYNESVHRGEWISANKFSYFSYPLTELYGKTLGIFGYGSIGRAVARIGRAFGMNIIVSTRTVRATEDTDVEFVSLDELFRRSDYLSLHAPLTKETNGLVNKRLLSLMKPTAFLINTARGGLVVEADLTWALNSERISGAGIDVLDIEPMVENHPYLNAKNCIITPHIAWATGEARGRLIGVVYENLKAYFDGKPQNVVNHKA